MYFTGTQKKNQCLIIGDKVLPRSVYYFRKFLKLKPTRRGGFSRTRCPRCSYHKKTFCVWLEDGDYFCEYCSLRGVGIVKFHSQINQISEEDSFQILTAERPFKVPETYDFDVEYFKAPLPRERCKS